MDRQSGSVAGPNGASQFLKEAGQRCITQPGFLISVNSEESEYLHQRM